VGSVQHQMSMQRSQVSQCQRNSWHTGSFLALFDGDHEKVEQLDDLVTKLSGFEDAYPVTGQTYSCKIDIDVLAPLTSLGKTANSKIAMDL